MTNLPRAAQRISILVAHARLPLVLFGAALIPRLAFWMEWNRAGLLALPVVDAATFDGEARGLLAGTWPGPGAFWQAPLYSYFLGLLYSLFGVNWEIARLAQAFLGAGSAVLTFLLARAYLGRSWSLLAYGICAMYGTLLYYEGQLLRETLATFLLLLWLLVQLRAFRSSRPLWWGLSGILLGLGSLCRENTLILAPLVLVWGALVRSHSSSRDPSGPSGSRPSDESGLEPVPEHTFGGPFRKRSLPLVAFALGVLLALAPVTIRNWKYSHSLVPISSSGGINFYIGNNPETSRTLSIRPGRKWEDLVARPRREAGLFDPAEQSTFFSRESWRWLARDPGGFAANLLQKTLGLFTSHEIKRNQDLYEAREGSVLLRALLWKAGPLGFPFGILAPVAFLGIVLALRRGLGFLAAVVMVYAAGIVLFFPSARYRLPLIPLLAVFAATGLAILRDRWRSAGLSALRRPALFLALFIVLVNGGWVRSREDPADQRFLRGTALAARGRNREATAELEAAVRMNPQHGEAWTDLTVLYGMAGRMPDAIAAARRALEIDAGFAKAWFNLGSAQQAAGDVGEAEVSYRRALEVQPDLEEARLSLARILVQKGEEDLARDVLLEGVRLLPTAAESWLMLGSLESRGARWAEAERAFRRVLELSPKNPDAWNNLGVALAQSGRIEEALTAFRRTLEIDPRHRQATANRARYLNRDPEAGR